MLQMVEGEGDNAMILAGYRLATQQLRAQRTSEKMSVNSAGEAIKDFQQEVRDTYVWCSIVDMIKFLTPLVIVL